MIYQVTVCLLLAAYTVPAIALNEGINPKFSLYNESLLEQGYQRVAQDLHNGHRSRHHVGGLAANEDLNGRAVQCAQYYANKGTIDHSCPYKNAAGENLWAQWGGSPTNEHAARSSDRAWYSEEPKHDYNGDWQPGSGHFTQLVWKNSREFGFGTEKRGI